MSITSSTFGNHLIKMLDIVIEKIPNNTNIVFFKNAIIQMKSSNPKLLVKIFYNSVTMKYQTQILDGNISFFETKDYREDILFNEDPKKNYEIIKNSDDFIITYIEYLKQKIVETFTYEDKLDIILYFQQLVKMSLVIMK
jgi:hypothetical protein